MGKHKELYEDKINSEPYNPPNTDRKYNATIRIPCEQFAFIEMKVNDTPDEIISVYKQMTNLYKGGTGLPEKEFQFALDRYLTESIMEAEAYVSMNKEQQDIIQNLKRAFKRINRRLENNQ